VIVLDASAGLDWILRTPVGLQLEQRIFTGDESVHAPHLLDLELSQVLRRLVREGKLSADRAEAALENLMDARLIRYPHFHLLPRIWELRNDLTAYDAAYVALAELLDATLVTRDGKLSRAAGHRAQIEIV
jgi:predicted nucleic acid-binding protein